MTRRIVFVTGGAGFIGSNIVATLSEDPALDVVVCDRLGPVEQGKWRNLVKHPIGDLVPPEAMFDWLERRWRDIELVVHTAAVPLINDPDTDRTLQGNFGLSRDLYRWCTDRQRRFVYLSTAATYGDGSGGYADRDDVDSLAALRPLTPYAWSKALFDLFAARQAARDYAPPQWVGLKPFTVYGPNEYHKGPMRSLATQIWPKVRAGQTVQLFKSHHPDYSDGGQRRDFVYVRDVANIVAFIHQSAGVTGIYNVGTGVARSFAELAGTLFAAAEQTADVHYFDMPRGIREQYNYHMQADMQRLRAAGYTVPMTVLEAGIGDYVSRFLLQSDPYR